jgi:hypothetical protein
VSPDAATMTSNNGPLPDIVGEAHRILEHAAAQALPVRVVGGLAIRLHASGSPRPSLTRTFKDIDLVTERGRSKDVSAFIASLGYVPDPTFNTMNAGRRGLFYDVDNNRQLDLFIGSFEMCHRLPIADRLGVDSQTVPLAELLLTKLQIVELNEKDLRDIIALLVDHEVGAHDADTVNAAYVAKLCSDDWGLWRTCKLNIERARESLVHFELSDEERATLVRRLDALWGHIEEAPKSRRWKLRDRVGDRVRWYEEPEEVG